MHSLFRITLHILIGRRYLLEKYLNFKFYDDDFFFLSLQLGLHGKELLYESRFVID